MTQNEFFSVIIVVKKRNDNVKLGDVPHQKALLLRLGSEQPENGITLQVSELISELQHSKPENTPVNMLV